MNLIDLQDNLKNLSDQQLAQEMQAPSGHVPQYLVLSELQRRKSMRDSFQAQQAKAPSTTVAEDALAGAGMPQGEVSQMARSIAPQSSIAQNTGIGALAQQQPQGMAEGGIVRKFAGGMAVYSDPAIRAMASREGKSVEEWLRDQGPQADLIRQQAEARAKRNDFLTKEPAGDGILFPTQEDLNRRYADQQYGIDTRPLVAPSMDSLPSLPSIDAPPVAPPDPLMPALSAPDEMTASLPRSDMPLDINALPPEDDRPITEQFSEFATAPNQDLPMPKGPTQSVWSMPDETQRSYNWETGKFEDTPTVGTMIRRAGRGVGDAAAYISDKLPDLTVNDPYSELTPEEFKALSDGKLSPETADALQSARLTQREYGRGTEGSMTAESPEVAAPAAPTGGDANAPAGSGVVTTAGGNTVAPAGGVTGAAGVLAGGAGSGGAGGAGMGGGAAPAGMSSYEQMLMDAMTKSDKRARQDKWLALAQAGLAMMTSKNPSFLGAVGEGGSAGLGAFVQARDQGDQSKLGYAKELYGLQAARQAAAARAASGSGSASGDTYLDKAIAQIQSDMKGMTEKTTNDMGEEVYAPISGLEDEYDRAKRQLEALYGSRYAAQPFDATKP